MPVFAKNITRSRHACKDAPWAPCLDRTLESHGCHAVVYTVLSPNLFLSLCMYLFEAVSVNATKTTIEQVRRPLARLCFVVIPATYQTSRDPTHTRLDWSLLSTAFPLLCQPSSPTYPPVPTPIAKALCLLRAPQAQPWPRDMGRWYHLNDK